MKPALRFFALGLALGTAATCLLPRRAAPATSNATIAAPSPSPAPSPAASVPWCATTPA